MFGLVTTKQYNYMVQEERRAKFAAEGYRVQVEEILKAQNVSYKLMAETIDCERARAEQWHKLYDQSEKTRKEVVARERGYKETIEELIRENAKLQATIAEYRGG